MSYPQRNLVHKIVDGNMLPSAELRTYLASSNKNHVVLTDDAAMEAYKGNTMVSVSRSMEILVQFPKQIIILQPTRKVCGLRGRTDGLRRRMIDQRQTHSFPIFCQRLRAARLGNTSLQRQLLANGRVAGSQMNRILADAPLMPDAINELRKQFMPDELKVIRRGESFPSTLVQKALRIVIDLTLLTMSRHSSPPPPFRNEAETRNTFLFRHAVCTLVWSLDWIGQGGADNVRADKLRNDLVDTMCATYATYFDGFLSTDEKALRIYKRAKFIVTAIAGGSAPG